jgi:hypothetical protein
MSILVHEEKPIGVITVGGEWTANTVSINGILEQVLVKSTSDNTMFDFSLISDQNDIVYRRTDVTCLLNEENNVPFHGIYTMVIANATKDEEFTILLSVRER